MLGQSSHRGHQSSGWISCVWSVCSPQNMSAASSHPFGVCLSSDCSKQNADKPNWTGERSYIHFSFKHGTSGKPQDIYNRGSRRQICVGEANKGYWLVDTIPRQGTESKKGEHWERKWISVGKSNSCCSPPIKEHSCSTSMDILNCKET